MLRTLDRIPDHEAVLYADGGCTLNVNGTARLAEYQKIAEQNGGLLLFELGSSDVEYTKADTGKRILPEISQEDWGKQRVGGIFVAINTNRVRDFFREALMIASERGYHYIDDSPSLTPEHPKFIAHRHDQSITSLLSKKYGFSAIPDETYPPDRCYLLGFPVVASRRQIQKEGISRF